MGILGSPRKKEEKKLKNIVYVYENMESLESFIEPTATQCGESAQSVLIQIFSASEDKNLILTIANMLKSYLPIAEIVATTTVGEIAEGQLSIGGIVLSLTFFEETELYCVGYQCNVGEEAKVGSEIADIINNLQQKIAGILVLTTALNLDTSKLFESADCRAQNRGIPVFGGGAAVYNDTNHSWVFCNDTFYDSGVVSVAFLGENLQIFVDYNFGWQPLGRPMHITESEGTIVKKVDNRDAFELYHRYLDIENDSNFLENVLAFPFMVERDGYSVARVPFFSHEDNSLEFVADIVEGETFRLGYGDPDSIIDEAKRKYDEIELFNPDAIFLYACICRRFLMQDDVNLETGIFQELAPTSGFFTSGEFFSLGGKAQIFNSTIVIVGMKENLAQNDRQIKTKNHTITAPKDIYSGKHNHIISSLLHFINSLSAELETSNKELTKISEIDRLTQISNRIKLDFVLQKAIFSSQNNDSTFSVIMADIDYFKGVNDSFGHLFGDKVLAELSDLIRNNVRKTDTIGRWGGEEFLLILLDTEAQEAVAIAEKLRKSVEEHKFPVDREVTCSFGVAEYANGDNGEAIVQRADNALYLAKRAGRNTVVFQKQDK